MVRPSPCVTPQLPVIYMPDPNSCVVQVSSIANFWIATQINRVDCLTALITAQRMRRYQFHYLPSLHPMHRDNRATISSCSIKLAVAMVLLAALHLSEDKRMKMSVFAIIFMTVHSTLGYILSRFATGRIRSCKSHWSRPCRCLTQCHGNDGHLCVQIGYGGHIPRWESGSVLTYTICTETFPDPDKAVFATNQLTNAIYMWKSIGVTFKQVMRDSPASFQVVYRDLPVSGQKNVLASAFFPNDGSPKDRTLYIYLHAFSDVHINNQAKFLAHEIGHILGLRHEFSEKEGLWSATWMNRNPNSVMEYYGDSSLWCVQEQDIKELKSFYDSPMTEYHNTPVHRFSPKSVVYPRDQNLKDNIDRFKQLVSASCPRSPGPVSPSGTNPPGDDVPSGMYLVYDECRVSVAASAIVLRACVMVIVLIAIIPYGMVRARAKLLFF